MLLLEAAIAAFLDQGFHQTGIRDIAKRAGVSLGNLYNHFPSKEAVLIEIAEVEAVEINRFCASLENAASCRFRLRSFFVRYASYACRPENALLSMEIYAAALRSEPVATVFTQNQTTLRRSLAQCLSQAQSMGDVNSDVDADAFAGFVIDAIEAQGRHCALQERTMAREELRALWTFVRNGLAPPA